MLNDTDVQTMLPVRDLKSAEKFYEDVLGLTRTGGQPDMVSNYLSGITSLCVYRSEFAGTNKGTAALWQTPHASTRTPAEPGGG